MAKDRPWSKKRPDTDELVWKIMQFELAHGPLEPWEIPLVAYDNGEVTIVSIQSYLRMYKAKDQ